MRRYVPAFLSLALLLSVIASASHSWVSYRNERFGYSFERPPGLTVVSRSSDKAGVIWQTGTVRVEVSGSNNPYKIKPHEWFAKIRSSAGHKIVFERDGYSESGFYWYEVLYLKNSRRVHRKTCMASGSINTLEVSYGYGHREAKQKLGQRMIDSFKPGNVSKIH